MWIGLEKHLSGYTCLCVTVELLFPLPILPQHVTIPSVSRIHNTVRTNKMKTTVIVPTCNKKENIKALVLQQLAHPAGVIDDGASDGIAIIADCPVRFHVLKDGYDALRP